MARIGTYSNDNTINDHDRLIGTDGGRLGPDGQIISGTSGATKNFTISGLRAFITGGSEESIDSNVIPLSNGGGGLDASVITQVDATDTDVAEINIDGSLRVQEQIFLGGNVRDLEGNILITPTGENRLGYLTDTITAATATIQPYSVVATTEASMLTLPPAEDGVWVKIVQLHRTGESILLPNAADTVPFRLMNTTIDGGMFVLDDRTASFEMIYMGDPSATTVGWVIIGAS